MLTINLSVYFILGEGTWHVERKRFSPQPRAGDRLPARLDPAGHRALSAACLLSLKPRMKRASIIYGGSDEVQACETCCAVVSLLPLGLCSGRAEGAVALRWWSSCCRGKEQLCLTIWPAARHLGQKYWTKPWPPLHAKCSLYSPACRAHVISAFLKADFACGQVEGDVCQPAPHAFISSFSYQSRWGQNSE